LAFIVKKSKATLLNHRNFAAVERLIVRQGGGRCENFFEGRLKKVRLKVEAGFCGNYRRESGGGPPLCCV
jgi:hypothetical protein